MSRAKVSKVSRERVKQALADKNMLQKELADNIGMNYQALNRALKNGRISERILDQIGLLLDVAPEYLAGHSGFIPGAPKNYWVHLAQNEQNAYATIIRAIWIRNGFYPDEIPSDDFWGLYNAIEPAIHQYISFYRKKQSEQSDKSGHNTQSFANKNA